MHFPLKRPSHATGNLYQNTVEKQAEVYCTVAIFLVWNLVLYFSWTVLQNIVTCVRLCALKQDSNCSYLPVGVFCLPFFFLQPWCLRNMAADRTQQTDLANLTCP